MPSTKKKILIINTGGTISATKTNQGYQPAPGYVSKVLMTHPAVQHDDMPEFVINEYQPLIDSSNLNTEHWNQIASDIEHVYDAFDGFVILHGTDTMAYSASALSFMLENLSKPVILTGSQIPLSEVRNDAIHNLVTSLWIAAHHPVSEVMIYFNQYLLRGNRAQKISSDQFNAFNSANFPRLAKVGINIELNDALHLKTSKETFHRQMINPALIANFRLFPGFSLDILTAILEQPLQALVLETYGSGNAQNNDKQFFALLTKACERGMIIVNCSQCPQGRVRMERYATGYQLKQVGLLSAHDMTLEATHCKLLYLFSKYDNTDTIKRLMQTNLRGELSER